MKHLAPKDSILVYGLDNHPIKGWLATEAGKQLYRKGEAKPKNSSTQQQTLSNEVRPNYVYEPKPCIDWYWIDYDPETGVIVAVTYLYSTGDCDNAGGGDGGTPQELDPCQEEYETFATLLSDRANVSSAKECEEVVDIETFKKYKKIKWTCLKNVSWILSSKEIGIVELVSGNWRWVSLTHDDIALTGIPVGGTVTPNKGTGTPNFVEGNNNIKYASMDLDFDVTYKPNSFNCNGTSIQIPPYSLNYVTHSQLYNAAP
jgi:hypothetical protein